MKRQEMKSNFFSGSDDFVFAISCGAESFEIEDGAREEECTFEADASGFEFENMRMWLY